jgi:hypothetical protein
MKKAKRKEPPKKKASRKAPAPKRPAKVTLIAGKHKRKESQLTRDTSIEKALLKQQEKGDTLLGKGPKVPEVIEPLPEGKEPWTSETFNPEHPTLICKYCSNEIHCTETPVVLKWGAAAKESNRPSWMGRIVKEAAHYRCDREDRENKGLIKKRKEPKEGEQKPATGKAPVEREAGSPRKKTSDSQRIFRVEKKNPRKEGSHGWNSWNVIKDGMTVADYLAAGGRRSDLAWDIDHGWTELKD